MSFFLKNSLYPAIPDQQAARRAFCPAHGLGHARFVHEILHRPAPGTDSRKALTWVILNTWASGTVVDSFPQSKIRFRGKEADHGSADQGH